MQRGLLEVVDLAASYLRFGIGRQERSRRTEDRILIRHVDRDADAVVRRILRAADAERILNDLRRIIDREKIEVPRPLRERRRLADRCGVLRLRWGIDGSRDLRQYRDALTVRRYPPAEAPRPPHAR